MLEGAQARSERLCLLGADAPALLEAADSRLEDLEVGRLRRCLLRAERAFALGERRLLLGERIAARRQLVPGAHERLLGLAQLCQLRLDPLELVGLGRGLRLRCGIDTLLLALFQLRGSRVERGLAVGKCPLALGERRLAGVEARLTRLQLLSDRGIGRSRRRGGRRLLAGRERRLAGGELVLPCVELGAARVQGSTALLGLGQAEADRGEPRATLVGRPELLLALLDAGERVGELRSRCCTWATRSESACLSMASSFAASTR